MDMSGEYRIPAPQKDVWDALNDPEVLKASIPGCEELVSDGGSGFAAKVRAKVGPVNARFSGKVSIVDPDPPNGYRIEGEGTGGAAGFANGGAKVSLVEDMGETILTYEANASVGGKLAQIGSRLIDGTAKKMADEFFRNFSEAVVQRTSVNSDNSTTETRNKIAGIDETESVRDAIREDVQNLGCARTENQRTEASSDIPVGKSFPLWGWIAAGSVILIGALVLLS